MSVQTVDEIALKIKVQDDGSWVVENLQEKIKKSTKNISKQFGIANKSMVSWMKNMAKATGIFAGFYGVIRGGVNVLKGLISDTENFDTELTQVATLVDTTQVNIDQMSDKLFNMAGAMGSVGELTQGTYMEISSSVPAKNAINELTEAAIFAAGGQADLSDSVNLGTTALNTFGEAAGGTKHVFDVLWQTIKDGKTTARELAAYMGQGIPIWKEAGMSFEEVGASLAVMTQISGNTSISVTALRGILSEVIKPSQEAAKEAERIGANFNVAAIKSMGFENWLRHLLDAVQKNNGDMATLFGRVEALNGIYQLTRNNLQNFTEQMKKHSNVTGNNQEAYEKYLQSFKGSWNEVKNKLQALFIQVILPLMKEFAKWLRENSDSIMSFARNVIEGFRAIIGIIAQFKDIIILVGKVWFANFAIQKVMPIFTRMGSGLGKLIDYYKVLRLEGQSAMSAVTGAMTTATGTAEGLGAKLKSLPASIKISVALVGAELVGRALAKIFDLVSDYYDKEMTKIIEETERTTGVTGKLNREIANFVRVGGEHKKVVEEIKKTLEFYGYTTDNSTQYVKRLHNLLGQSQEWREWQENLKNAGAGVKNLSISLEENQRVYKDLAKAVGNYTQAELEALIKQGIITETQKAKLLELQGVYQENQKVIEEQIKATDELAKSMGILSKQGIMEQSKYIKDLMSLYPKYQDQIIGNEDTLKKWVDKIDELSKTALPNEKEALQGVREELIYGFGEYNKQILSVNAYENQVNDCLNALFPFTGAIIQNKDALYSQAQKIVDVAMLMSHMGMGIIPPLNSATINLVNNQDKVEKKTVNVGDAFKYAIEHVIDTIDAFEKMGVISTQTAGFLQSLVSSIGAVQHGVELLHAASKMDGKGFLGFITKATTKISGLISIASAGFSILKGIISLFSGDGVGEAINRERQNIDISQSMEKIIRETEEAIGDTHAAISLHFKEIVQEADITISNIANYWQRARDILADLDRGTLSAQEAALAVGESFNALLSEAQRLGTEGSKEMLALIGDVRNRGLEVAEITEYVNSKLTENIQAISNYISTFKDIGGIKGEIEALNAELANGNTTTREATEIQQQLILKQEELSGAIQDVVANWDFLQAGTLSTINAMQQQGFSFIETCKMMSSELNWIAQTAKETGLEVSEGLQAMTNMAAFISQHEELAQRIEATQTMMQGLADTDFFNETDFNMFLTQTKQHYQEILKYTDDEEMALRLISPILQDIIKYGESYNFVIDEETQGIINLAQEHKVLGQEEKSHNEIMLELWLAIADALGAKIPESLREMVGAARQSVAEVSGEFTKLHGSIGETSDYIDGVSRSMTDLDERTKKVISGNTILLEWEKWREKIHETDKDIASIPNTMRMLDTEFADSSVYLQTIYAEFQRQTLAWKNQLESVEKEMETAARSQMPELETRYNEIMNTMAADTSMFKDYLLEIADKIGLEIPNDLTSLQDIYSAVMNQMSTDTQGYKISADGVLMTLNQIIGKQAQVLANQSGFGSSWGVYTDGEKAQITAEFKAMAMQWKDNRALILSDESYMRNFYNKIIGMKNAITDDYLGMYSKFATSMGQWWRNIQKGRTWDEENKKWIDPVSAASGISFIVPTGYEDEQKGYPMMVHSGELVQVYTQQETQRILNREFNAPMNNFYEIPDFQPKRQFNDGLAPYFVPGKSQTINYNDFKFGLTNDININLKSETKIDKDELEEIVLELVDDEYRGFGNDLAERLERRLKK